MKITFITIRFLNTYNPFASIGRTGTSKVRVLNCTIRRTGTSTEKSVSKVSLWISGNNDIFLLSFMVLGKHSNL